MERREKENELEFNVTQEEQLRLAVKPESALHICLSPSVERLPTDDLTLHVKKEEQLQLSEQTEELKSAPALDSDEVCPNLESNVTESQARKVRENQSLPDLPTKKRTRRKIEELEPSEIWVCSRGCGKKYRYTSAQSIQRHCNECQFRQFPSSRELQTGYSDGAGDSMKIFCVCSYCTSQLSLLRYLQNMYANSNSFHPGYAPMLIPNVSNGSAGMDPMQMQQYYYMWKPQ